MSNFDEALEHYYSVKEASNQLSLTWKLPEELIRSNEIRVQADGLQEIARICFIEAYTDATAIRHKVLELFERAKEKPDYIILEFLLHLYWKETVATKNVLIDCFYQVIPIVIYKFNNDVIYKDHSPYIYISQDIMLAIVDELDEFDDRIYDLLRQILKMKYRPDTFYDQIRFILNAMYAFPTIGKSEQVCALLHAFMAYPHEDVREDAQMYIKNLGCE